MTDKPAPFAEGGKFHDNIRNISKLDDSVLKASMKKIGWVQECPAIKDEHGVVIVGHRRLKIAAELGITPVIEKLEFGDGPSGQAKRLELAAASNIGFQKMDKSARKKIAEEFYEAGWTQKQIADVLEVEQGTVSKDLEDFIPRNKVTRTDSKGRVNTGRPKKSTEQKAAEKAATKAAKEAAAEAAREAAAKAKPLKEVDPERGRVAGVDVKADPVVWKVFNEQARKEKKSATAKITELITSYVNPEIKVETLSLTAQQKYESAIKQTTRRLEVEIEKRVREENLVWLKNQLDQYNKNAHHYELVLQRRGGIMTKTEYRSILSCLHPDRVQDPDLKRRYEHAFNLFTKLEKAVLSEKESPTPSSGLPKTVEELLKRKAEFQARKRAAKQTAQATIRR